MKRFIAVGIIWLVCVGGVALYMHARDVFRDTAAVAAAVKPESASARFDLELTPTFDAQPDPFALSTDDSTVPPLVSVRVNDVNTAEFSESLAPGQPWLKTDIKGVVLGTNELLIEAAPPVADKWKRHAIRVRLLKNNRTIVDKTFWSESGEKLIGTLRFKFGSKETGGQHDH